MPSPPLQILHSASATHVLPSTDPPRAPCCFPPSGPQDCAETAKNVNKNNSLHAILFEALGLVMQLDNPELVQQAVQQLGRFIAAREPNTRYLGLANMGRLSVLPDVMEAIRMQQRTISDSLNDPDISIRRRALDLLYSVCDRSSAESIVNELLNYLLTADFAIREELTLKVAILAERFAVTLPWYVEVILTLLDKAGDYVSDDIWHRLVQMVTNHEELHRFAAERCVAKLREGAVHEVMVKVGGALKLAGRFTVLRLFLALPAALQMRPD